MRVKGLKTFILIITIFGFETLINGDILSTYRIRTDQESYYQANDNKMSPFWTDWNNKSVYDSTCTRVLHALSKTDGNVTVSVKSAATTKDVYLLVTLKYDHKAPTYKSIDIPIDALVISFVGDSLGAVPTKTDITCYSIYVNLTRDTMSTKYCTRYITSANCVYGCQGDMCAEVLEVDSTSKAVEIRIAMNQLSTVPPLPGMQRGIELRYYTSVDDAQKDLLYVKTFKSNDTSTLSNRLLLGNLEFETHFNDSVYKFTSPASNSKLIAGSLHTITWGTTVHGGILGLDYSPDHGINWNVITQATANDGSQSWQIPFLPSDKYLLRMRSAEQVIAGSETFSVVYPVPELFQIPYSVTEPVLQWLPVEKAVSYRILIDTQSSFQTPLVDDTVQAPTYYPLVELPYRTIYWKVASDLDYNCFSIIDTFKRIPNSSVESQKSIEKHAGISSVDAKKIRYNVKKSGIVKVELISLSGKVACILYSGFRLSGEYEINLSENYKGLMGGKYVLRFRAGVISELIPFVWLK